MDVKEVLSIFLSLIIRLIPIKRKFVWHSNIKIIAFALLYLLLFAAEIIAFNRINHFGAADWWNLVVTGYSKIRDLIAGF